MSSIGFNPQGANPITLSLGFSEGYAEIRGLFSPDVWVCAFASKFGLAHDALLAGLAKPFRADIDTDSMIPAEASKPAKPIELKSSKLRNLGSKSVLPKPLCLTPLFCEAWPSKKPLFSIEDSYALSEPGKSGAKSANLGPGGLKYSDGVHGSGGPL